VSISLLSPRHLILWIEQTTFDSEIERYPIDIDDGSKLSVSRKKKVVNDKEKRGKELQGGLSSHFSSLFLIHITFLLTVMMTPQTE